LQHVSYELALTACYFPLSGIISNKSNNYRVNQFELVYRIFYDEMQKKIASACKSFMVAV